MIYKVHIKNLPKAQYLSIKYLLAELPAGLLLPKPNGGNTCVFLRNTSPAAEVRMVAANHLLIHLLARRSATKTTTNVLEGLSQLVPNMAPFFAPTTGATVRAAQLVGCLSLPPPPPPPPPPAATGIQLSPGAAGQPLPLRIAPTTRRSPATGREADPRPCLGARPPAPNLPWRNLRCTALRWRPPSRQVAQFGCDRRLYAASTVDFSIERRVYFRILQAL